MHRQNVIANNLANQGTTGFRRDLAMLQERQLAAQELPGKARFGESYLNNLGGGQLLSRSESDFSAGTREETGNALDVALGNDGFFAVEKDGKQYLTRNGNFAANERGEIVLAGQPGVKVLGSNLRPLVINPAAMAATAIQRDGSVTQNGNFVGAIAVKDAPSRFMAKGPGQMFEVPGNDVSALADTKLPWVQQGALEHSNVDPTTELTAMMDAMRQLEANANLIKMQDQTLGRLVNDVARVS
jgi:flagellar basal body rod protein FlgG